LREPDLVWRAFWITAAKKNGDVGRRFRFLGGARSSSQKFRSAAIGEFSPRFVAHVFAVSRWNFIVRCVEILWETLDKSRRFGGVIEP
jgi:hypothetical protein